MIDFSIVIPTYKSEKFIKQTILNIYQTVSNTNITFEIIVVNDGNNKNVASVINEIQKKLSNLILINFDNNYGQQIATHTGIKFSKGKYIVTTDDDLQYSPNDILRLYNEIIENSNYDIICGFSHNKVQKTSLYKLIRRFILFFNDYLFFPNYRKAKFFTPFKIYNRNLLFENGQYLNKNVYYFWDFDYNKIKSLEVNLHSRLDSNSSYGFLKLFHFMKPIIIKMVMKAMLFSFFIILLLHIVDLISTRFLYLTILTEFFLYFTLRKILENLKVSTFIIKDIINEND